MAILLHHNANEIVSRRSISGFYIRVQAMANQGYRVYRAQETSATEPFAIALLCGDVRCDVSQIYPFHLQMLAYITRVADNLSPTNSALFWRYSIGRKPESLCYP